jgi:hypothetical protein
VPTMLKYLFDINPTVPMSDADQNALPKVSYDKTTNPGTDYLSLTYRKYAAVTGTPIIVQTSPDMIVWTTVTPDLVQQIGTAAGDLGTSDPIMEVGVIVTGTAGKFIRLTVTSQ